MLHLLGIFGLDSHHRPIWREQRQPDSVAEGDDWRLSRGERDALLFAGKIPDDFGREERDEPPRFASFFRTPYL